MMNNLALEPKSAGPKKYKYYWIFTDTLSKLVGRKFVIGYASAHQSRLYELREDFCGLPARVLARAHILYSSLG